MHRWLATIADGIWSQDRISRFSQGRKFYKNFQKTESLIFTRSKMVNWSEDEKYLKVFLMGVLRLLILWSRPKMENWSAEDRNLILTKNTFDIVKFDLPKSQSLQTSLLRFETIKSFFDSLKIRADHRLDGPSNLLPPDCQ